MRNPAKIGWTLLVVLAAILLFASVRTMHAQKQGKPPPGLAFNVGKTQTRTSMASSTGSTRPENATFNSRHLLIIGDTPTPLSQRIRAAMVLKLKELPQIERVEIAPPPSAKANPGRAPDLFLRVELVDLKQQGLVTQSLSSTVHAALGTTLGQSSHLTTDAYTAPIVQFMWQATLQTDSMFEGIRSDKYAATVQSVVDEFAKGISNQLNSLSASSPSIPDLPASFYGPYEPIADFDFLTAMKAERLFSCYGLLDHNETFWKFQTSTNPGPQLEKIAGQLTENGWKLASSNVSYNDPYVRATRESEVLELFRTRNDFHEPPVETNAEILISYRKAFSKTEREATMEKLFTEQRPIDMLQVFENSFSKAQRERFYALAEKTPITSPRTALQLAEHYWRQKQTNAAVNMLIRSKVLVILATDSSQFQSQINDLARKISPKKELTLKPSPEIYRELGFLELTNASQTIEVERPFNEPLMMFADGDRGVEIISMRMDAPHKSQYPWILKQVKEGSSSTSSSSYQPNAKNPLIQGASVGNLAVSIRAVPIPENQRIRFTVQMGN